MNVISLLADGMLFPLAALAVFAIVVWTPAKERYQRYVRIVMAGLTSYVAAKFIAALWQPTDKRPFELLGVDPGAAYLPNPGFPSDHALFALFLTLAAYYATRKKWVLWTLLFLTIIVCIGRVVALVHTPLDVIGGLVVACVGTIWYRLNVKNVVQ